VLEVWSLLAFHDRPGIGHIMKKRSAEQDQFEINYMMKDQYAFYSFHFNQRVQLDEDIGEPDFGSDSSSAQNKEM
jgi:hypothetical protein